MSGIVVFEDNPLDAEIVSAIATRCGRAVRVYCDDTPIRSGEICDSDSMIVLDIILADGDAFSALEALAEQQFPGRIILISGHRDDYLSLAERVGRSAGLNIAATLRKPVDIDRMQTLLSA